MQAILVAWYGYLALMSALLGLSGSRGSAVRRLGASAGAASLFLLSTPLVTWPGGDAVLVAANAVVLVAGLTGLALGPRADTRQIALLLSVAASIPLLMHFWVPPA